MNNREDFERATHHWGHDAPVCPECGEENSEPDGHGFDNNQEMTWTCAACKAEFLIERDFSVSYTTYARKKTTAPESGAEGGAA